jgi:hypothetical protein
MLAPSVPGSGGDLGQSFAPEPLADFGQHGSFRIGQAQSGRQVCAQNPIFCCQVFILEEQFLVNQAGPVGEQTSALSFGPAMIPRLSSLL